MMCFPEWHIIIEQAYGAMIFFLSLGKSCSISEQHIESHGGHNPPPPKKKFR